MTAETDNSSCPGRNWGADITYKVNADSYLSKSLPRLSRATIQLEKEDQHITITIEGSEELVEKYLDKMVSEIERS